MKNESRVRKSIVNMINGLISQGLSLVFSFAVRTVFIKYLNEDYLGINGLFTNILTMLSLAELGFGTAVVYSMYKPLANNEISKLQALMKLYAKVYTYIGIVIAILGVSIIPFMDYIIKDPPNVEHLIYIYFLFLVNSVVSYFFAYKRSILSADQKEYICSQYKYIFTALKSVLQILTLVVTGNFILYLYVQLFVTITENIFISIKVNKMYPFLKEKNNNKLNKHELTGIKNDVKALVMTKFGHVILNGTDNIIISSFLGVSWVGKLSNYTLITGSLVTILSQITSAITASIGNFIAKEHADRHYKLFKMIDFINFWIYGFCTVCLTILLNPFISLWIGPSYILNQHTIIVLSINFLISGIMTSLWMFRSTMGLFVQGQYRHIITAVVNIIFSIILAKIMGLVGVLFGTTISRVAITLWYDPYIIYKHGFKKGVKTYYLAYLYRAILLFCICLIINVLSGILRLNTNTVSSFIALSILCLIIPNIIFVIIFSKAEEFRGLRNLLHDFLINHKE